MSRIGKLPVPLGKVKASIEGSTILYEGPKGKLSSPIPGGIEAKIEDNKLLFNRTDDTGPARANQGLARSLAANCVNGLTNGYKKQLQIIGVGYRVAVKGSNIDMFLGHSHNINFPLPKGITASTEMDKATKSHILTLEGIDKQLIGQVAANIRSLRPPEPYKGKGVRYLGEHIRRKAGKTGK